MIEPVKVVVLAQPRTGSTLLCSLLNSAPGVRILVEPINTMNHKHHMKPVLGASCLLPEPMVQTNLKRAFNILFSPNPPPIQWIKTRSRGDRVVGFKIMAHQIRSLRSEAEFWQYLVTEQVRVILCLRYNILMQYVSDMITIATRQPACWDGAVRTAQVPIRIAALESALRQINEEKQYLIEKVRALDLPRRRIKYEDFKDSILPVENILYWLSGERYALTTKLSKQNPDSLRARVTNYEDVVAEIHRLQLSHLLVDTEAGV